MKVVTTKKLPSIAKELLLKNNIIVKEFSSNRNLTRTELIKFCKDADGIISVLSDKFDQEIIDQLPKCKIIANYAVGFNNIDICYAKQKGIVVTNTPDVLTDATAEIAVSLILTCSRKIIEAENFVRMKKFKGWEPQLFLGIQLTGKMVGIVGAGRIGQATAKRMKSFGCEILYYSKNKKLDFEKELNANKVSLEKLLKESDIISIHLPLNSETKNLLSKDKLDLLKPTAIVINTARGEIIDEKYLIYLLKNKKIFSAGFDVYENEPKLNKFLFKLNNVVLLPHIGSATLETRNKMAELAANNIINVFNGKNALTPVG
ncbi:MAG: D-glycerate dehydrogenase [Ignavibacteriae bacterium]|nr:D-glycerate dehydrogenase [Ignavibacteriota bacterium]